MLELSRKLATIDTAVPLAVSADDLARGEPDPARLRELYTRLELRALLRSLDGPPEPSSPPADASAGSGAAQGGQPAEAAADRRRAYEMVVSQEALSTLAG